MLWVLFAVAFIVYHNKYDIADTTTNERYGVWTELENMPVPRELGR